MGARRQQTTPLVMTASVGSRPSSPRGCRNRRGQGRRHNHNVVDGEVAVTGVAATHATTTTTMEAAKTQNPARLPSSREAYM